MGDSFLTMPLRIYIGICVIFFALSSPSRAQQIEDIERRIRQLNKLADRSFEPEDSILLLSEKLRQLSEDALYDRGVLYADYFKGTVLGRTGKPDSSISILSSVLKRGPSYDKDTSALRPKVEGMLGNAYYAKGNYQEAMALYLKSSNTFDSLGKKASRYAIDYNIGRLHLLMGEKENAFKYFNSIRANLDILSPAAVARLLAAFGTYYSQSNELDSAEYYYQLGLEKHREVGDLRGVAHGFNNLAIVAYQKGNVEESIVGFESALEVRLQLGNLRNISDSYYNIGVLYAGQNNHRKAIKSFREGLQVAKRMTSIVGQRDIVLEMAGSFNTLGQNDSAYYYMAEWRKLNDEWLDENRQEEMLALEKKYETDRIIKEQEISEKQSELRALQRNALFVGLLVVLIIAVIVVYTLRLRYQRNLAISEKEKTLAEKQSDLTLQELNLKKEEIVNYTNQLLHKNEILDELRTKLQEHQSVEDRISTFDYDRIAESISPYLLEEKDWLRFKIQFERAYPGFFDALQTRSNELSSYDQRLASLLKINLSNKEIGQILNISTESVAKAKYRLRQKLDFTTYPQLETFIHEA